MERNRFLEADGLFWESDTHEWFNDKISTEYAQKKSVLWGVGEVEDKLNVVCFVVREKQTGKYNRVIMDVKTNEIIFETTSLEKLSYEIDRLKVIKRFK